jgi:LysR family hydrogen peroxide-inducible transcriptional activator
MSYSYLTHRFFHFVYMTALPTLTQLRHLLALHSTLNFTRAAEAVFITQSTLSASIRELETTLEARLVERDKRNVMFTDLGQEVVRRAQALVADTNDLVRACHQHSHPFRGKLVLSAIPTIAPYLFPKLLPLLRRRYTQATFYLREEQTLAVLNQVRNAQTDIGVIALPFDTPDAFTVLPVREDPFLFVSRDTPALHSKALPLARLNAEPLLLLEDGHCLRDHAIAACSLDQLAQRRAVSATSVTTLLQMVESGVGSTLLPELAVRGGALRALRLCAQPIRPTPPARTLALVLRKTSSRQREATHLVKIVRQLLAG